MNEIMKIHLGRQPFTIAVEAYKALRDYLDEIEEYAGSKSDVLKEVEARMAELLTERGIGGDKVVLAEDIDFLKEQLGRPHDFMDEDNAQHDTEPTPAQDASQTPRRLFRDTDQAMVGGVAAGLAAYFGVDVVMFRLLFVILGLSGGSGLVVYFVLWMVMPEAQTRSEKLQMRGKAVTVDSLRQMVERADVPGAANRVRGTFAKYMDRHGKVAVLFVGAVLILLAVLLLGRPLFWGW